METPDCEKKETVFYFSALPYFFLSDDTRNLFLIVVVIKMFYLQVAV